MNRQDYSFLAGMIRQYMDSLKLDEVIKEFQKKPLLATNQKMEKGPYAQFENMGLSLLPASLSGENWCTFATKCKFTCLVFSGVNNFVYQHAWKEGKLTPALAMLARRSFLLQRAPEVFKAGLAGEILRNHHFAEAQGKQAWFRLNVFSDIDWSELILSLPQCHFYDYTKVPSRMGLENYYLTFSASENTKPEMLKRQMNVRNVAVVFDCNELPKTYQGYPVISGDEHDCRYLDPRGVIVGLKVKKTIYANKQSSKFFVGV